MHHSAIVLNGPQTNSSIASGGLCSPEVAPEPKPYRRNLCSGSLEPGRMALTLKAGVSTLPFLGILAVTECHTLIAKKSPPRLPRPSASSRHVARHGGLGDAETQHQKFTMDPRRTPEKVLTGHPYDQMTDFAGNPRAPAAPATACSISPKR
jgi:hypothetical protein